MMLEGEAKFILGSEIANLQAGEFIALAPGTLHAIEPLGRACFFALNLPGMDYPEDVYVDAAHPAAKFFVVKKLQDVAVVDRATQLAPGLLEALGALTDIAQHYYQDKFEMAGYCAFTFPDFVASQNRWSLALLDVMEAPAHFHQLGCEHFLVLNGRLDISLNDERYILHAGQSVHIPPQVRHHLKSADATPVRLLCVNFPAFDPGDFFLA